MKSMIRGLIDTNLLVYAHHKKEGDKHAVCAQLLNTRIDEECLILSIQNLVEFSRVLGDKSFPSIDKNLIRQYVFDLSECSKVLFYNAHTIMDALTLSKEYKLHFFDALLAATMQENGIDTIYSENSADFKKIPWLTVINPFKEEKKK